MNHRGKALPVTGLEKKRAKYETLTNRQILIPELCDVHPIPASLWRKAVCIPSVLYRVSSILLAEELRKKIFRESHIGEPQLPLGCGWPDLDFGWDNEKLHDEASDEGISSYDTESDKVDTLRDTEEEVDDTQHSPQLDQECHESEGIDINKESESDSQTQPVANDKAESSESDIDCYYDSDEHQDLFNADGDDQETEKRERQTRYCFVFLSAYLY